EAKKESKPVDGREARGKEVKQGGGGLSSDSGKGSTGEEAGKKKAKKDRGRRAIEETVGDVTDAGVTSEATGGVPKEAEPQQDSDDRGVHGGGRGGEGPGSAGAPETDGVVHPEGGDDGSSPEGGDPSQCQKTGSDKGGSKQQMTSSEKRKKRGASGRQSRQTTTGAGQQPGGFSETRTDTTVASGTETMATDRRAEDGDSKADDDGQGALQGPPAGAEKDGGEDAESEEAGGKDAAGAGEADDESAAKEALRTGARPKTSSAISKRKQKKRPQRTELPVQSEPPSIGSEEEATAQTRGRARQRTLRDARRGGPVSGHEASKGIVGSTDSRRGAGGQSSDRVSGKGSRLHGEKASQVPSTIVDATAASLHQKLMKLTSEYWSIREQIEEDPETKHVLDDFRMRHLSVELTDVKYFYALSRSVLLEVETSHKLGVLLEVANGFHKMEMEQKQGQHGGAEDNSRATSTDEESLLSHVVTELVAASNEASLRAFQLLEAEKWYRGYHIIHKCLPPFPNVVLSSLFQTEHTPKSDASENVAGGHTIDITNPLDEVKNLQDSLYEWQSAAESSLSGIEKKWWIPPPDADEARRQHARNVALFAEAVAFMSWTAYTRAQERLNLVDAALSTSDPVTKQKLNDANKLLETLRRTELSNSRICYETFCDLYLETGRANAKNPGNRWDPLPSGHHAPDIRASMAAASASSGEETSEASSPVQSVQPVVSDVTKTNEEQEGDESTT
ncbi:Toxoplasma gondii family E protein, partial [Toxoplasma gondii GT1]